MVVMVVVVVAGVKEQGWRVEERESRKMMNFYEKTNESTFFKKRNKNLICSKQNEESEERKTSPEKETGKRDKASRQRSKPDAGEI